MEHINTEPFDDYVDSHRVDWVKNRFITITFKKNYEIYSPSKQFQLTARWISRWFSDCCSEFTLVPEQTEQGRIHYHAQYRVKDHIKYHKTIYKLHKRGFISVSFSKDCQKVQQYIMKHVVENREVYECPLIPITKDNWKGVTKVLQRRAAQRAKKVKQELAMLDKLLQSDGSASE